MSAADLTLRHSHRTALRRIARGEPVGDLGEALGALYLHDLIRDDADGRPVLSEDGRKVLEAHDALVDTRRLPRPTPTLPAGWREDGNDLFHRDVERPVNALLLRCDDDHALVRTIRQLEAMVEIMRWEQGRRVLARMVETHAAGGAS